MVSVGASYLWKYVVKGRKKADIAKHGFVLLVRANVCVYMCVCSSWRSVVVYCCAYVFSCACGVREHVAGASRAHLCPCMCGQADVYIAIACARSCLERVWCGESWLHLFVRIYVCV